MGKDKIEYNPEQVFKERKGNHEVFYNEVTKEYFAVSVDTSKATAKFADLDNLYGEIAKIDEVNKKAIAEQEQRNTCAMCGKIETCTHKYQPGCTEAEANAGNPFLMF